MDSDSRFSLMIVDDDLDVLSAMKRLFSKQNYRIITCADSTAALRFLTAEKIDLVLLDLRMPGMDGMQLLEKMLEMLPSLQVIMLTGYGGVQEAVAAMKCGAMDFIEKSVSPDILLKKIGQVYKSWQLETENRRLRSRLETSLNFDRLIGASPPVLKLKDTIARIAPTDISVLVQGESGTGKELVAQAIHQNSLRKTGPFVPVDCGAISDNLIESELFGHSKGAFTGADTNREGLIRSADKGTLFLDEIGELSLAM